MSNADRKSPRPHCYRCDMHYVPAKFNRSINPQHKSGYLPCCKECIAELTQEYMERTKDEKATLWLLCANLGVAFRQEVYQAAMAYWNNMREKEQNVTLFGSYMSALFQIHSSNPDYALYTFADTDIGFGEVGEYRESEVLTEDSLRKYQFIWGKDKLEEDIKYLEYRYNVYTKDKELSDYQEKLYRSLCLAELAEHKGEDTIDKQQKIAKTLKIDQFQVEQQKTLVEEMLESQIYEMEKKMPCEMYDDKELYKDYCGIGDYWDRHILRCIRNLIAGTKDYPTISKEPKIKGSKR